MYSTQISLHNVLIWFILHPLPRKWWISTSGKEKEQVTTQFWGRRNIPKKQVGKTEYGEKGQQNFHAVSWQLISC